MSFLLTDEQRQIGEESRRALEKSYSGAALKALLEVKGQFDQGFWSTCRELGWTAVTIPEAYGGLGLGAIELTLVAQACGRVVCGAPFLLTSYAAAEALLLFGDEALKSDVLPRLAAGDKIGTVAFAEDANPVAAKPALTLSGGRLSGRKTGVLAGAQADLAVVLAAEGGTPVLALADLSDAAREVYDSYDNTRGLADLTFADIPARKLNAPDGVAAAWAVLRRAAVIMAAEQLGGADQCLEKARDYANTRQAFGQPIGKFQAIKHKIAEMYVANEIARANILEAALRLDTKADGFDAMAAAARVSATEAFDDASREATQVHGGIGVTWESDLHLYMRRARSQAAALGSRFVWEDQLVQALEAAQ